MVIASADINDPPPLAEVFSIKASSSLPTF
jgi:hypothetical protein